MHLVDKCCNSYQSVVSAQMVEANRIIFSEKIVFSSPRLTTEHGKNQLNVLCDRFGDDVLTSSL